MVLSLQEVDALIARGGVPSTEEFDALFARWRTLPPDVRDGEQNRLAASLAPEGKEAWHKKVWCDTYAAFEGLADERLRTLNGQTIPMVDDRPGQGRQVVGSAIDFWRFWKEWWVKDAASLER